MKRNTVKNVVAALGIALAVPFCSVVGAQQIGAPAKDPARIEEGARQYFTDLPLVNQDGEEVRFFSDVLRGQTVLISFIFTNCQDACPMITHHLSLVKAALGESMAEQVRFVSISIDPERDTPEALRKFREKTGVDGLPAWVFLTGDKANVDLIVQKLGQYSDEVEAHSTLLLGGNVRTAHWMKVQANIPAPAIAEKLRLLATEG